MKKIVYICLLSFLFMFVSCDFFYFPSDEYFWSLVDEYHEGDEETLIIDLKDNQQFFMTRGDDNDGTPGYETENQAQAARNITSFELSESTNELVFDNSTHLIEVKDLSFGNEDPDYHVFQIFEISNIIKDKEYTITGTTWENGTLTVDTDTIKVIFK